VQGIYKTANRVHYVHHIDLLASHLCCCGTNRIERKPDRNNAAVRDTKSMVWDYIWQHYDTDSKWGHFYDVIDDIVHNRSLGQ